MSNLFENSELTYDELLTNYERISKDYQNETQNNAQLKEDIKHYINEVERLESIIREFKKVKK